MRGLTSDMLIFTTPFRVESFLSNRANKGCHLVNWIYPCNYRAQQIATPGYISHVKCSSKAAMSIGLSTKILNEILASSLIRKRGKKLLGADGLLTKCYCQVENDGHKVSEPQGAVLPHVPQTQDAHDLPGQPEPDLEERVPEPLRPQHPSLLLGVGPDQDLVINSTICGSTQY